MGDLNAPGSALSRGQHMPRGAGRVPGWSRWGLSDGLRGSLPCTLRHACKHHSCWGKRVGLGGLKTTSRTAITLSGLQPGLPQKVETTFSCSASLINLVFQTQ